MRGTIRFVAVLLSAAACGELGAFLALPVALVTPEVAGWPLALAAGALCSSLGAFRAGKRFSSPADRGCVRLLSIVGASGMVTAVVAVVILGLMIPVAPPTVADHPVLLLGGVGGISCVAGVAALPPPNRARVSLGTVALLALAVMLAAAVPITVGSFGCDSGEKAVFGEFPQ